MPVQLAIEDQMTIEEFLAFTAERPDDERWELIEGQPVMNATPTDFHQIIATNILVTLDTLRRANRASWIPLIGVGTRVPISPRSLPQPDVMVKANAGTGQSVSDEALVLFEVLSPSNDAADQAWRRKVYASIPNLQHYVTVSQKSVLVTRHDRASGWQGAKLTSLAEALLLDALGGAIPLTAIYRDTPRVG
ncbi:MAG: Uma2 family endonuclease [Hyphomicrobiaceae bacterium]